MAPSAPTRSSLLFSATVLAIASALPAMEEVTVGPRALGMGGVGVACAEDTDAQYYNPATFGFFGYGAEDVVGKDTPAWAPEDNNHLARKSWGIRWIDVTVGARINGDLATYADQLLKVDVDKLKNLGTDPVAGAQAAQDLIRVAESLSSVNPDTDSITANVNAGTAIRIGHFGIGGRVFTEATVKLQSLDLNHLGVTLGPGSNLGSQINAINQPGFVNAGFTPSVFTPAQITDLANSIFTSASVAGSPISNAQATEAANRLDFAAAQAGIPAAAASGVVDTLKKVAEQSTAGNALTFGANTTTVRATAVAVGEIPITYGYAFNPNVSIGGSFKVIVARVYGQEVQVFDAATNSDSVSDLLKKFKEGNEQTVTAGLDLGMMARTDSLQVGLTGRNLNAPKLKGPTVDGVKFDDVRLDPEVDVGVAVIPFYKWYTGLTLAADYQVLRQKTTLPGYDSQRVGAGAEWKVLSFLDVRAGVSKNLASADVGPMIHAGIGVNLWLARLDAGGAIAREKVTYDGKEYPKEVRGSLALSSEF